MTYDILLLVVGIALIILGGNYVTDGAVAIASRFRLSPMLIGITVVAFGSSTPDFVVSLFSTIHGKGALALGNILGAVIFDMLLVVGIMALMKPIVISKRIKRCDLPVMALASLIVFICAENRLFDHTGFDGLSRADGIVLLLIFILFMLYTIFTAPKPDAPGSADDTAAASAQQSSPTKKTAIWLSVIYIVGGLAALVFGGRWVVSGASALALKAGMSEALVGIAIVGVGSSLPDLATSLIAVYKGESAIALGNIVGSCIMDTLFVLGTCAIVRPLGDGSIGIFDFGTLAAASLLLVIFAIFFGKSRITRIEGVLLIAAYIAYILKTAGAL